MPTINPQFEDIKSEMEKTLKSLAKERGDQIVASIKLILFANLDRGRIQGFMETHTVSEYVLRVTDYYTKLNPFISRLQIERAEDVWEPLFENLQRWTYNFLIRKNFSANLSTRDIAIERATAAAITILDAHFPYDTEFEPWVRVIVLNTCFKFFRDETKKSHVPQQNIVELDETLSTIDDPVLVNQKRQEDKNDILNAIVQLSNTRRQVIKLYYLDELPLPEIAKIMNKTVGAIHSLHFNALQDLRKILGTNRDNT